MIMTIVRAEGKALANEWGENVYNDYHDDMIMIMMLKVMMLMMMILTMMLKVMMLMMMIMTIFRAEGEALAKEWGENVLFFETSAKSDINVKEVILIIVMTIKAAMTFIVMMIMVIV